MHMGNPTDHDSVPNPTPEAGLAGLLDAPFTRRQLLKTGLAGAVLALPGCATIAGGGPLLGFTPVSTSTADTLVVPPGYNARVLYAWGDATGIAAADFRWDGSNSAEEQELQAGMQHDAIEFFALPGQGDRGLLAMNHEYVDDGLLHADGMRTWNADKVRKSQAAHGVSVVEVELAGGGWRVVRPSRHARRIMASTPIAFSGPAAGHALLRTAADPKGMEVLGTFNNCAGGRTPWGTYLTCEENFNGYFAHGGVIPAEMRRYGIGASSAYRWQEHDRRFDAQANPNEPNRFGWVVEIDPYDRNAQPVKRTALGRFKHEGAMLTTAPDGRVVVYMGDDEGFEYVYKFVSSRPVAKGASAADRAANMKLLDEGTLYVAKFAEGGRGEWVALVHGQNGLTAANGFADQASVLVHARRAGDVVGATRMDRPEWAAVHPRTGEVYITLTNNGQRGAKDRPGPDAANPRANNVYGHILRWREAGSDAAATTMAWDIFVLGGEEPQVRGAPATRRDAFGSPDGLWFDARGVLWIQTDAAHESTRQPAYAKIGNNQMLAADVSTGEIRRFLTGPVGCEITGVTQSPDGRSMFVNIQHPGEVPNARNNDPANPRAWSNWPDFRADGRPRSATVVIRRDDGGLIGT